jgi:hypothetical protein
MRRRKRTDTSDDVVLARTVREAEAAVAAVREKQAAGTARSAEIRQATEAAKRARAAKSELAKRDRARSDRNLLATVGRRKAPLEIAAQYDRQILEGSTLNASNLSDDEIKQLRPLLSSRGRPGELTGADLRRYEKLVGKAAGDEKLFERRRAEIERAEKQKAEAERLHRLMLPRRRPPEPGSIELPRFLFDWVTDGNQETFDLADLGVLAGLAFSFFNETASLFARGSFEQGEGVPTITIRDAAHSVHFAFGANPDGRIQARASLAALHRNKWIQTRREGALLHIQPGERMRKLIADRP